MTRNLEVTPDQIWADNQRPNGQRSRRLRVMSVHPHVIHNPAYVRVQNIKTGRESGIQLQRLVTNFTLVGAYCEACGGPCRDES